MLNILLMHSSTHVSQRVKVIGISCFSDAYIFLDILLWFCTFLVENLCLLSKYRCVALSPQTYSLKVTRILLHFLGILFSCNQIKHFGSSVACSSVVFILVCVKSHN